MAEPLRNRQTKEAATDMFSLQPTRHISTLHEAAGGTAFKARVRAMGIRDRRTSFRSPWQNGYVERLIGSIRQEMLIRRIAEGDQLAMRTLFGRYRVPLYRWLLRLVGGEALAEDLLSNVFLDVWRQTASFEASSSVSTWLLSIARYKALCARRPPTDAELD